MTLARWLALVAALCGLAAASCSADPATQIVVVVSADTCASLLERVDVSVTGPGGASGTRSAPTLPQTLTLAWRGGSTLGPVDVTVTGVRAGMPWVSRRVRTRFVDRETRVLAIVLSSRCAGASCGADQTCVDGACTGVDVEPSALGAWSGAPPEPMSIDGGCIAMRDAGPPPPDAGAPPDAGTDAGPPPCVPADCDDRVDCTHDVCAETGCTHTADDALCTAMPMGHCDVATRGCQYPACTTGAGGTCNPSDCVPASCMGDVCSRGECTRDDCCPATGDPCTVRHCSASGTCDAPVFVGGGACDDGNLCTTADTCDATAGRCQGTPMTAPCDDGDPCTTGDRCGSGACRAGGPLLCDDGNPCTADSCDAPGGCSSTQLPDGTFCNDGNLCTMGDMCLGGTCVPGPATICDDLEECTTDGCVPVSGCVFRNVDDATPCSLMRGCAGACMSGHCMVTDVSCRVGCSYDVGCGACVRPGGGCDEVGCTTLCI